MILDSRGKTSKSSAKRPTGATAVDVVAELVPDVVLMDVRMPVVDGIEATRRIVTAGLPTRIIILTTYDLDEYVYAALAAGASGFMLKDVRPAELAEGVRVVARGDALLAATVTRRLLDRFAPSLPDPRGSIPEGPRAAALAQLTERETEVLRHLAAARSNGEIAEQLTVSEATMKTHVSALLRKLGLRDRVQAVVFAYEAGLVQPTR